MNIAFLTNILINRPGSGGGYVHASQVAHGLMRQGHNLYTNLSNESDLFTKFTGMDFIRRGKEIDVFYIRIHGAADNDALTILRQSNPYAPCVWEVNSPLEELRTRGISEDKLAELKIRRKQLAKMVNAAICVSDEMAEYSRDELGIKDAFVVPNGSDPGLFRPELRDESTFKSAKYKVLYSASFKYKWQDLMTIESLAAKLREMKQDDVLIAVTAEGRSESNLMYIGNIPYTEIPRYIASADVGLCLYENFDFYKKFYGSPTKLYDYMASGLPVIGTGFGQIKHVIETTRNGLVTDNSVSDLLEKILFLKNNPIIAEEMRRRGRGAVVDTYNWGNVAVQTEAVLLKAIEDNKASAGDVLRSMAYRAGSFARWIGQTVLGKNRVNDIRNTTLRETK